jgi:hypothetical protein
MATQSYFNKRLLAKRVGSSEKIAKHVEVFTNGGVLYLRIGPPPNDSGGEGAVTIELPTNEFVSGVQDAGKDLGDLPQGH